LIHEENNNRDDDEQAMLKAIQAVPSGKLEVGKIGSSPLELPIEPRT
jgi:ABC-type taurine transport system substrate-binding protein